MTAEPYDRFRPFAVGCLPLELPLEIVDTEWPKEVRAALARIASVSAIDVDVDLASLQGTAAVDGPLEEPLPHDNHRDWFWPEPDRAVITFDVHIPKRMHPDLLRGDVVGAENFRVRTKYGYDGPCTFVSVLGALNPNDVHPSRAVALIHAFINSELLKSGSKLRMGRVGPSPFHMDGLLRPSGPGPEKPLSHRTVARFGYEMMEFHYDSTMFSTVDEAEDALQESVEDQLQLFYKLQRERNQRLSAAMRLSRLSSNLVEKNSASGVRSWFVRVFLTGGDARRLGFSALQSRLAAADDLRRAEESISETLGQTGIVPAFDTHLRKLAGDDYAHAVDNASEVVKFAEASRKGDFEVIVVSASTLLGGVAGGLVALLVSGSGGSGA